ncbi:Lanosterol synthase [Elsinoe australis]|uniref:Terpene cyclase/mutase family member n=1 Tax=Elsinoe australis TaxID=40998 RepID=A0A2P7Z398_9PEZI|nr:Lanosterol synthase [Elsinoe australis]
MGKQIPFTSNGHAKPVANGTTAVISRDEKTDYSRWRLRSDRGQQIWTYLTPSEAEKWPQNVGEKYHLGLATDLPKLARATTPLQACKNGFSFFSQLQTDIGNWTCEYGGPMFLLPGIVLCWYATETPIPEHYKTEIRNYLYARQHPDDGGWGLHIEGESSVFGCALNYTVMRICGADKDDPRMIRARARLHELGGAVYGPHWAKFWLSVLGVMEWDVVNPVPPELWLLPDWVPIAPWRWWIHMRQVFLPMSFIWSRKWVMPETQLTRELREELFTQPHSTIKFASHRNSISDLDNYHPKSWLLNLINFLLVFLWIPFLRTSPLVKRAEDWVWWLIQREDLNTDYADLAPVNAPMNTLACYIREGPDSHSFKMHISRLTDYIWVKDEGMLVNGTNGVQTWDTAFAIQAAMCADLHHDPSHRPILTKALTYIESQQMLEEIPYLAQCYRHSHKGAWAFSTKNQSYTVSDCTAEGVRAVMMLQNAPGYPALVPDARITMAIDLLLTMQNEGSGGCSSYEPARGGEWLEYLNAAEVFGKIMVEYDYVECTTAVVTALSLFNAYFPDYRAEEIRRFKERAVGYIRRAQREDGSWYGAWGICFTYAGMFAMEALASVGENWENSERVRRGCQFFLDKQMEDGGWGETYRSCEKGVYSPHEKSQVVNTAWVVIAMVEAGFPDRKPLEKAVRLIMSRQQANGEWKQEAIEGVFNKSCMISYPNYKFIFPIKALGLFAKKFGDIEIL